MSTKNFNPDEMRLCYVDGHFAWFTSCPLDLQWGDDWDDAPYEHNAGYPYDSHYEGSGTDRKSVAHVLYKVAWEGPWETPCANQINSRWSVQAINRGAIAWLIPETWRLSDDDVRAVPAGTTFVDFLVLVKRGGGEVYCPHS